MERIAVLTGAGISVESGLSTYRDTDGMWENYKIDDVATSRAFRKNPKQVLEFFNMFRRKVREAVPNDAHFALSELERHYHVDVITQNIDDLHERAGSSSVIHLHGEILKAKGTNNPNIIIDVEGDLNIGDKCRLGSQLRPHVVLFDEPVPLIKKAYDIITDADILIVIGTSLQVYPAAGLLGYADSDVLKYIIDPAKVDVGSVFNLEHIQEKASVGMQQLLERLTSKNKTK